MPGCMCISEKQPQPLLTISTIASAAPVNASPGVILSSAGMTAPNSHLSNGRSSAQLRSIDIYECVWQLKSAGTSSLSRPSIILPEKDSFSLSQAGPSSSTRAIFPPFTSTDARLVSNPLSERNRVCVL